MNIKLLLTLLVFSLFISGCSNDTDTSQKTSEHSATEQPETDNHDHDEKNDEGHGDEHAGVVKLTPVQIKSAGIVVNPVSLEDVVTTLRAPGEVVLNAYKTIKVTPRIPAQVIARHARLGDYVERGQPLITLSSVEMAEAQGQLLLAEKEWERVKKLGRNVVAERRYIAARVEYEKAYAKVKAYGMSETEITALFAQKHNADGSFNLVAQQAGRVLHDKFIVGERVEAGYELMVISDESIMWIEARMTPSMIGQIDIGNPAEIQQADKRTPAKVIQLHHTLDETTRTSAVRLEVENTDDQLHAGMFVTTFIATHNKDKAMQIPESAVLRSSDGNWQVMVEQEEAGEFKAVEVDVKSINDGKAVISGIQPGTRVVSQGAFFVRSEMAKGSFEIDDH